MSKRILVTGSSGRIGQATVRELMRRGHWVRGFDLVPSAHVHEMIAGSLTDVSAVVKAVQGMETVIHLAATPDDDDFLERIVPNNLIGVHHVLESAQKAGVKRLVLASSGQVVWYERLRNPNPITVDTQPTPRSWYAAAKMFLEAAGRAFAEKFGMEVIAVRLGWCPRTKEQVEEIRSANWAQDVYLSPGDAGRFFSCSAEAKGPFHFEIVYATSIPVGTWRYDMKPAKELLGFEPMEKWPTGIEVVTQ